MDDADDDIANPYLSPTLEHLDQLGEPVPGHDVACTDCPVSVWYATKTHELTCFCSALHTKTWFENKDPVTFCDAREQAIADLIAKLPRPQRP